MIRNDGRRPADLRPVTIETGYLAHAEGSALISMGGTTVLCAATTENRLPRFAVGTGSGWITAEYSMLPRSTHERTSRERNATSGRTAEIQRLIGRSLRAATDLEALGERTVTLDCDVLQADGGTRTAAISGAYVALLMAMNKLCKERKLKKNPVHGQIAAVSVGIHKGIAVLDLDYAEDSQAETDMNVVMNEAGRFIEVQGTAEGHAFTREEFDALLELAGIGIGAVIEAQTAALEKAGA